MEYRENPKFGRKIFFLNPPLLVDNYMKDNLTDDEFEVYAISDYQLAKAALRHYENAICFIYIDDDLSMDGWYNFIKSFEIEEGLQSIFLGVMSYKAKPKDKERFLMNLKLPGGFIDLNQKPADLYAQVSGILTINGAKGIRKVIRLDLQDNNVLGYFSHNNALISFTLKDISTLGFAARAPLNIVDHFVNGRRIDNVSLTMGRYSVMCSIVIYNKKIENGACTVVAIFDDKLPKEDYKKIHDFIYATLAERNAEFMKNLTRDYANYETMRFDVDPEPAKDADDKTENGEAKTEGQAKTEGEAKIEGKVKTEGEAKIEGEGKPEGEKGVEGDPKPESENKPDHNTKSGDETAEDAGPVEEL